MMTQFGSITIRANSSNTLGRVAIIVLIKTMEKIRLLLTICVCNNTKRKSVQVSHKLFSKLTLPECGDVGSIIVDEVNLENCFTSSSTHPFTNCLTLQNEFSFHSPDGYLIRHLFVRFALPTDALCSFCFFGGGNSGWGINFGMRGEKDTGRRANTERRHQRIENRGLGRARAISSQNTTALPKLIFAPLEFFRKTPQFL